MHFEPGLIPRHCDVLILERYILRLSDVGCLPLCFFRRVLLEFEDFLDLLDLVEPYLVEPVDLVEPYLIDPVDLVEPYLVDSVDLVEPIDSNLLDREDLEPEDGLELLDDID